MRACRFSPFPFRPFFAKRAGRDSTLSKFSSSENGTPKRYHELLGARRYWDSNSTSIRSGQRRVRRRKKKEKNKKDKTYPNNAPSPAAAASSAFFSSSFGFSSFFSLSSTKLIPFIIILPYNNAPGATLRTLHSISP